MKLRLCALVLSMGLFLSGCSAMLEREHVHIQPHTQNITSTQDPSSLQAKNYQELVSAVLLLITRHDGEGTVRLYNYTGDPEGDLAAACLEVVQKDPLGAYGVDYIKHELNRIVSYYEASVDITYRRTAEEMSRVVSVTGSSAIKTELREALSRFSDQITLRISYFGEDEDYLRNLVTQAYYSAPEAAFGMPQVAMTLYPDSGIQRIVDLALTYPIPTEELEKKRAEVVGAAAALLSEEEPPTAGDLYDLLRGHTALDQEEGGSTAYAALVEGRADPEGFALAYQLLCQQAGLRCTVVQGEGERRFWNIVSTPQGSRHVDCSQEGSSGLTDAQLQAREGYLWGDGYPLCRDGAADGGVMEISP